MRVHDPGTDVPGRGQILAMIGTTIAVSLYWLDAAVLIGGYFTYSATAEERFMVGGDLGVCNKLAGQRHHALDEVGLDEGAADVRSEEHTSELQSLRHLVCRLLLDIK